MLSRVATKRRLPISSNALSVFSHKSSINHPIIATCGKQQQQQQQQQRCYSSVPSQFSILASIHNRNPSLHCHTQVRFKRNDGSKAFNKQRKVDKKGQKKERRRKYAVEFEKKGKHSAPGSAAGPRREWVQEQTKELIDWKKRGGYPEDEAASLGEYGVNDALLDDLLGNSAHLTSTPSPEPIFLGDYHPQLFEKAKDQVKKYEKYTLKLAAATTEEEKAALTLVPPPNDREISLVLRAYRDKNGTKTKPIGLHKALLHIMQDLHIPTTLFGEHCYSTLLTCCKTPKEAAKVMLLMSQRGQPINEYTWSILIDIHARLGDFEGCNSVMDDMKVAGVPPGLPAYTSLLAACYKVCNSGTTAPAVKARAGDMGWEKWKELRINGVEADAMAYGAIIRLLAARGRAEQAISTLQEMRQFQVKPTTLCFTAALKGVARSHEISVRYENGASRRFRRREQLTLYHGRMTRDIIVMAEQAEVVQDDGFVTALIMCAAAAGDSATAKAIVLASEVRRMDQLRTIGPDSHLLSLRGLEEHDIANGLAQVSGGIKNLVLPEKMQQRLTAGNLELTTTTDSITPVTASMLNPRKRRTAFEEREFGDKDNRVLTALMHACASAVDPKGMGDMWSGKNNKGYLHENSLRLIATVEQPRYHDNSIPGTIGTEVGLGAMNLQDDGVEEMSKRLRRKKYEGGREDSDIGTDMDTIDTQYYGMFEEEYLKREQLEHEDTLRRLHLVQGRDWTGMKDPSLNPEHENKTDQEEPPDFVEQAKHVYYDAASGKLKSRKGMDEKGGFYWDEEANQWKARKPENGTVAVDADPKVMEPQVMEPKEEWYFDQDEMKWMSKMVYPEASLISKKKSEPPSVNSSTTSSVVQDGLVEMEEEYFFDSDELKWKTRAKSVHVGLTAFETEILAKRETVAGPEKNPIQKGKAHAHTKFDDTKDDRSQFTYDHFKSLMSSEMDGLDLPEEEAQELFESMKKEFDEQLVQHPEFGEEAMQMLNSVGSDKRGGFNTMSANSERSRGLDSKHFVKSSPHSRNKALKSKRGIGDSVEFFDPDGSMASMLQNPKIDSMIKNWTQDGSGMDKNLGDMMSNMMDDLGRDSSSTELNDQSESFPVATYGQDVVTDVKTKSSLDYDIDELQAVLPGMPRKRLLKVREAFRSSLNYPSMIALVPLLRENMPNRIDNGWLKQKNILNAYFCVEKAKAENSVDHHMVNGMLEVITSAGKVGRALSIHDEQFKLYGVVPNEYSDRLILQMLVKNRRLCRALEFKQKIEGDGRTFDLASYGTLMEYYSQRGQVGSSLMMLRECVKVHGSPPKEGTMTRLRLLCRQQDIMKETDLVELAGPDPLQWLRHGEANLKREKSYAGRRGTVEARNISLRA